MANATVRITFLIKLNPRALGRALFEQGVHRGIRAEDQGADCVAGSEIAARCAVGAAAVGREGTRQTGSPRG